MGDMLVSMWSIMANFGFDTADLANKIANIIAKDENGDYTGVIQAQSLLAHSKGQTAFNYKGVNYTLTLEGENFFSVAKDGQTIGIAYKTTIMPIKAAAASGYFLQSDIAKAVLYAYENGAEVINMSFGGSSSNQIKSNELP